MARYLFAHWEGGGNTPPMLGVVRRLLARGHAVRVMSDPCNRDDIEPTGASFASWTRAPHRPDKSVDTDPLRDWEVAFPPAMLARLRDRLFVGPSRAYAEDVVEELKQFPADVVVSSEMLFGAMIGAEAAGVPCVALFSNVYLFPRAGVPPFGPGLMPARNAIERGRDWLVRTLAARAFGKGARAFNDTRRAMGLQPVRHPFDQLSRLSRQLVLTSAAFDFPSTADPLNLVYGGPELDDPAWTSAWQSPWTKDDKRPLVLVGFSTTFQNQAAVLRRVIEALGALDVRAVVTTGKAIDVDALGGTPAVPPNVHVCESAPHSELLRDAAAVITHCGHGTVIRALAAGVPLVCMPMGRDQNENAARVIARGAGVRLPANAAAGRIARAVRDLLESPTYRAAARALGNQIVRDARDSRAVAVLEEVALTSSRTGASAARQTTG